MIAIRVLLAAAWLVLAAPALAGDIARLDQQNGFRDARFGMERMSAISCSGTGSDTARSSKASNRSAAAASFSNSGDEARAR